MSGTAQERVSPSTGPPGCRGSPASETVSDHRLSSWELDWGLLTLPGVSSLRHCRISSGSQILAERWAPARPKGCAKAHPTLQSTLPVPLSTCAGSAKRGKGLFFLFFFGKHIYVYMYTHIFLSSSNSSSWKFAGQDQCLVAR